MKRREFMNRASMLSAGILFKNPLMAAITENALKKNIKIAVIGSGERGTQLIEAIDVIDGLELVAICDVLDFRLKNGLSKANPKTIGYSDYRDVLSNKQIDAVIIATPFYTQHDISIAAIKAKKHIYCETTIVKGIPNVHSLIENLGNSKKVFYSGYQYNDSLLYNQVLALLDNNEIGEINSFECKWNRKGDWRVPVPNPSLERAINWRMYHEYSGGLTAELSSHQIDFVNRILNENPKKIMGTGGVDYYKTDGRETFDNIHLLFEYPSGVKASFKALSSEIPEEYEIKIIGYKGIITLNTTSAWIKYYNKGTFPRTATVGDANLKNNYLSESDKGVQIKVKQSDPTFQALSNFKGAINAKSESFPNACASGHSAIAVQLSLDAMRSGVTQYWKDSYNLR